MKIFTFITLMILFVSTTLAQTYTRRISGDVIQTTPSFVRQVNQCWVENVPIQQPQYGYNQYQQEHSYTGAITGGVIGALVGSRFGKGSGKAAATGAGAIAGSVIGDTISSNNHPQYQYVPPSMQYTQRQVCSQRMVQMYNVYVRDSTGQTEVIASSTIPFAPGQRVIVVFYPNGEVVIE
jgi:outer membrane lipoprotein SlyB